jgi:sulfite oxidase
MTGSRGLTIFEREPLNASTPPDTLIETFITPVEVFFKRNHAPIPVIDPDTYRLKVTGRVARPLALTLDDVRSAFPAHTETVTLQCAGNRRDELAAIAPIPDEIIWDAGAIGNATWRGARLIDVLRAAGLSPEARHIAFTGLDDEPGKGPFGASIPIDKVHDALLVYAMNGKPLTAEHGFPLRMIVPGYIGARSVKWVGEISAQDEPSDNYYQRQAYKRFPPDITPESADPDGGEMLYEMPISAVICQPVEGAALRSGSLVVRGYAVSAHPVARVEVSADGGRTWHAAQLSDEPCRWAWRFWQAHIDLPPGNYELITRAVDEADQHQPESLREVWNFKGYVNNAWHRVRIGIE